MTTPSCDAADRQQGGRGQPGMLERMRQWEWERVKPHFRPGMRVLDLGGGSGYQARLMSEHGCEVLSIDLRDRPSANRTYFPVQPYDGVHVPAADGSIDAVFSSNVLEHIAELPAMLAELRRVLAPGGFALHVVPSASWRLWTSVTAFAYLVKRPLLGFRNRAASAPPASAHGDATPHRTGLLRTLGQAFLPHGEYPNAIAELYYFSRFRWTRLFRDNGWDVVDVVPGGLYYSGYLIFSGAPIELRRSLARVLGSSMTVIVTRPRQTA